MKKRSTNSNLFKALKKTFVLVLIIFVSLAQAQISGCTDSLSKNYNPVATINDGSCDYALVKIKPKYSVTLDAKLKETSSLTQNDSLLWTSSDDTDTTLYAIDTKGIIQNNIHLKNLLLFFICCLVSCTTTRKIISGKLFTKKIADTL